MGIDVEPDDLADLPHRRRAGRRGRHRRRPVLRADVLPVGFQFGLLSFTAAVLGGIGNLTGATLGGIVIGIIAAMSDRFLEAKWTSVIVFSLLILVLIFRPTGLLAEKPVGACLT